MSKSQALKELEAELEANKALPLREANLVFGEGDIDAKVVFVGEAPGMQEDLQKRPFVGRSGQLLEKCINELGWRRADVYITNIVKRRPPDNRDPLPAEIEAYKPYLTRQLEILKTPIIVPLGRFSMNYFLPLAKITRDQGSVFRLGDRFIVPMFHPAAALRNPAVMEEFKKNFKKLPAIIKKYDKIKDEPIAKLSAREPLNKAKNQLF